MSFTRQDAVKLIQALAAAALPDPAEGFSATDRRKFDIALEANLNAIYGYADGSDKPKAES